MQLKDSKVNPLFIIFEIPKYVFKYVFIYYLENKYNIKYILKFLSTKVLFRKFTEASIFEPSTTSQCLHHGKHFRHILLTFPKLSIQKRKI